MAKIFELDWLMTTDLIDEVLIKLLSTTTHETAPTIEADTNPSVFAVCLFVSELELLEELLEESFEELLEELLELTQEPEFKL